MLGGMLGSIGVSAVKSAHEKYKKHKKREEWRRKYEENDDIYEGGEEEEEEEDDDDDGDGDDDDGIYGGEENNEGKITDALNGNSDSPPPSYNDFINFPSRYSTGEQSVSGYQQQPKYPIAGMPGPGFNDKAPWQSAGQTFQDLINNRDAIEKEIDDIEEKINKINIDIESGEINATEGAAKVKSLMAEAKMKEKRLNRLQQQVIQQQGAMPLGQNMWQAQPGMMYAPQSPQGMPLFVSPLGQMTQSMQPIPGQEMYYAPQSSGMVVSPLGQMTQSMQPMSGPEMYYAPQPSGMVAPPQQMWSNGATEITAEESDKAAGKVDEAEESVEEEVTPEKTSENGSGKSSDSDVKEENTPYSTTHNAIFKDNEVERISAGNLEDFRIDELFEKMEKHFLKYLFGRTDEDEYEDEDEKENKKKIAAYKPYDEIIEDLFLSTENCYKAYKSSTDLYGPEYLVYKKALLECIQDWDSNIVNAFNETNKIAAEKPDSSDCYEEARKLMANLLNVIQPDAYAGFYIKSVERILGKKRDDDDDDSVLSLKRKSFKGDGEKYSINICYVATARTINNLIEVIKFIRGEDQNVAKVVTDVGDLCSKCIDIGTVIDTSRDNFRNMPSKIQDIKDKKGEVFGSAVSKVNDYAFDESLKTLRELVKKLNKINKTQEEKISIFGDLEGINKLLCHIPRNTADYKFQNIENIMTGIFTEGDYDSASKMFRK